MLFRKLYLYKCKRRWHKMFFAILVGFAVVAFWRGAWGIMDVYVFPDNYGLSATISLVFGMGLLGVTHRVVEELM